MSASQYIGLALAVSLFLGWGCWIAVGRAVLTRSSASARQCVCKTGTGGRQARAPLNETQNISAFIQEIHCTAEASCAPQLHGAASLDQTQIDANTDLVLDR
ncbi:hypothetical protein K437DRAFT_115926 [Tilletiaria anomala UBC 951]|uniref:Uncharacterized protein n=1 Tax=Tilletiaria anomala (strain ATCC 24038 / CBS 436.72 / UBC 951) TaxID=1037660 RepID=A0A066WQ05_TILAU|nr:uncharacterized protein K437DRAFT_115926 [Tilletiaria anomala UBC 951]KDN53089.1 hypothetical protein K437DRAFT_115926 [Tilletiaria anomala UBC 951]